MADGWSAAILTGGSSVRMGRDKALLSVDGEAMAARVARMLAEAGASAVTCVGGDLEGLRVLGLYAIDDLHPGAGPLGGVVTALAWGTEPITVVTPCDLVRPEAHAFAALVRALRANPDAEAALPILGGAWRPLPAALRRPAHGALAAVFAEGERAAHRAMARIDFVTVDVGPLPDADTPEDLQNHR